MHTRRRFTQYTLHLAREGTETEKFFRFLLGEKPKMATMPTWRRFTQYTLHLAGDETAPGRFSVFFYSKNQDGVQCPPTFRRFTQSCQRGDRTGSFSFFSFRRKTQDGDQRPRVADIHNTHYILPERRQNRKFSVFF